MKRKQSLFEYLKSYNEKGIYPLHMPGHKRRMPDPLFFREAGAQDAFAQDVSGGTAQQYGHLPESLRTDTGSSVFPGNLIAYDFTEVEGTDDLHHAEGILKDSMERTARVFGADKSYYLVNGSTSGNLIGVSAICPLNGELIVARNCHRSVFHALELRNITPHFVYPDFDRDFGIFGGVTPEAVEELFRKYPGSSGVVITSPTYEGVVSDIQAIAEVCHRHGAVLFVDEAHGAHFGLVKSSGFPESAVKCGADLSVQSAHKTLIGLTQTAFLHMKSSLVDVGKIERFIDIYETSSPSYPMMISLDACTGMVLDEGEEVFGNWAETLRLFDEKIAPLRHFRVLCHGGDTPEDHGFFDFDKSKLLVNCRNTHLNGESFMEIMRDRFGFELEMQLSDNALAMTGPGDDRQQILRFAEALLTLDREEEKRGDDHWDCSEGAHSKSHTLSHQLSFDFSDCSEGALRKLELRESESENECVEGQDSRENSCSCFDKVGTKQKDVDPEIKENSREVPGSGTDYMSLISMELCQAVTIQHAVEAESESVDISEAAGRISAEYVYCYPPGVPLLVPGETLDQRCVAGLLELLGKGYRLHFTKSGQYSKDIVCLKAFDKKII
ncbi:MAG: aminotransferase class V-fold PLP-dependent enzyme [Lachnospiraceae bacterium]|nr:aminotransferase class V-fold PLP-dependent enzyme [Lachnospiraceae bacterium]